MGGSAAEFNCDASCAVASRRTGMGCIFRDAGGSLVLAKAEVVDECLDILSAETMTLKGPFMWFEVCS